MIVVAIALTLLSCAVVGAAWMVSTPTPVETHSEPTPHDPTLAPRLEAVERMLDDTREAVAHGIAHVERVEKRINATVRRARKELEEHGMESPALEAEHAQLQLLNGDGGLEGQLPPVHEDVGAGAPSSVPGVTREQLQRARFG